MLPAEFQLRNGLREAEAEASRLKLKLQNCTSAYRALEKEKKAVYTMLNQQIETLKLDNQVICATSRSLYLCHFSSLYPQ